MLMEALVGLLLLGMVMGFATTVLVRAHHRFKKATRAADARAELARASRRMVDDIRRAAGAVAEEDGLVLTQTDGSRVTWRLLRTEKGGGRLVRSGAKGKIAYRAALEDMQVAVEERPGTPAFVAVLIELASPASSEQEQGEKPADRGRIIYIAASPRVRGVNR